MKPGDLIEWYYSFNDKTVTQYVTLWSSLMKQWVPVGLISMLVYQNDKTYSWINSKGCFCAYTNDEESSDRLSLHPRCHGVSIYVLTIKKNR